MRGTELSLLLPLLLVRSRRRRCFGAGLFLGGVFELFLLFLFLLALGRLGLGNRSHDLEAANPGGQILYNRRQLDQQGSFRVPRLQRLWVDLDPAGIVPQGRLVPAVSLVGLRDVPYVQRGQGVAQILDRGGVNGFFDADSPALFHRLGGIEVAGINDKKAGRVHGKAFLHRPEHLEIPIGSRWQMNHVLWWNHELLHWIAAVGHLFHHVLLGLGRALLFDANTAALPPHGVVEGE